MSDAETTENIAATTRRQLQEIAAAPVTRYAVENLRRMSWVCNKAADLASGALRRGQEITILEALTQAADHEPSGHGRELLALFTGYAAIFTAPFLGLDDLLKPDPEAE